MADDTTKTNQEREQAPGTDTTAADTSNGSTLPPIQTMPRDTSEEHHSRLFPILGVLLIVLILLLGGLYLWGAMLTEEPAATGGEMATEESQAPESLRELDTIAEELDDENFAAMEAELDAIDQEIESEMNVQ